MASDGIWDHVDPETVRQCIVDAQKRAAYAHDLVTECVFQAIVAEVGMTVSEIMKMQPGPKRRAVHDDITLMILWLHESPESVRRATLTFSK